MPEVPTLTGRDGVVLRAPVDGDAAARRALGRDAEVLAGYGLSGEGATGPTADACDAWLAERRAAGAWMIEAEGALAGTVWLHSHDARDARAQVAIGMLSARFMGRGLGRAAMTLVLDHAFGTMGLHRVGLRVLATNVRAIELYRGLGFREEGREREAAATAWGRVDDVIMGLLAWEWAP